MMAPWPSLRDLWGWLVCAHTTNGRVSGVISPSYDLQMVMRRYGDRKRCAAALSFTLAALAMLALFARAQNATPAGEQTFFPEFEKFTDPAPVPLKVRQVLIQRKEIANALSYVRKPPDPSQYFEATTVHLHGATDADLLVRGVVPISGADNSWYWIVLHPQSDAPTVALWCAADSLEVMETATNGYKHIQCSWSSASGETIEWKYHFYGRKYVLWKATDVMNR